MQSNNMKARLSNQMDIMRANQMGVMEAEEQRVARRRMMVPLNEQQPGEVEATKSWFGGLFG